MTDSDTLFAPAERACAEAVRQAGMHLQSVPYLMPMLDAFPGMAAILNGHRQIVAYNESFAALAESSPSEMTGMRLGEVLGCINADKLPGGCGTAAECRVCGAVAAMLSANGGTPATEECRITTKQDGENLSLDLRVVAVPIRVGEETYTVFSFVDISDEKRRKVLERVFFDQLLNTAGGIKSLSDLYSIVSEPERHVLLENLSVLSDQLIDEIHSQRDLLSAELHSLHRSMQEVIVIEILRHVKEQYRYSQVLIGKTVLITGQPLDTMLLTDPVLISRVLGNLLKNALEASSPGEAVRLHYETLPDGRHQFSVHNNAVMPEQVRLQVFQRSFSTKGAGRGIGTYSARLLTENYLQGTIAFTSEAGKGTTFTITLPAQLGC